MGYHTDFDGKFYLNKKLDAETHRFLTGLATTRRMKRNLPPEYGVEGEFYVEGRGFMGQNKDSTVVDYNSPPSTQPSLWCQWIPNEEGTAIEWDQGEKFYSYVDWIEYIIKNILAPRGYSLTGDVQWRGEDFHDIGCISIYENKVSIKTQLY